MIYPFISIIITALISIALAAMAIHPRYKKELIKKDPLSKFESVLYYQDMATMTPDDYVRNVKKILKDKEETYEHLIITTPINNLNYVILMDGKNRCKKIITERAV